MNGIPGGFVRASVSLYLVKFFVESRVFSHVPRWDMNRPLTCSQVRFSRRIGGELSPDIMAAILEKLCKFRHFWWFCQDRRISQMTFLCSYIRNRYKLFNESSTFPRILFAEYGRVYPISNLEVVRPCWN